MAADPSTTEIVQGILDEHGGAIVSAAAKGELPQAVLDAAQDFTGAIRDVIGAGTQLEADRAELTRKHDLLPLTATVGCGARRTPTRKRRPARRSGTPRERTRGSRRRSRRPPCRPSSRSGNNSQGTRLRSPFPPATTPKAPRSPWR